MMNDTTFEFHGPITTDLPQLNIRIPDERCRHILKTEALRKGMSLSALVLEYINHVYREQKLDTLYGPLFRESSARP